MISTIGDSIFISNMIILRRCEIIFTIAVLAKKTAFFQDFQVIMDGVSSCIKLPGNL
ncbi:MAG TPA: hypothetical protein VKM55_07095 [Candidatus Lokiarchaeia archaeon]|nr:hypothetical protein [Candidatus Lokiarchaeia archaeon]